MSGPGIRQPVEGVFLDIGYTMAAPTGDGWTMPPGVTRLLHCDAARGIAPQRIRQVFEQALVPLLGDHLVPTEQAAYEQYVLYYAEVARQLPELGITPLMTEAFARERIYDDGIYRLYDDVPDALTRLSAEYKLGIISDTWPDTPRVFKNRDLLKYFQSTTFSCELGVLKPDAAMYRHALAGLGVAPGRTVFVDDLPANLDGAAQAGIQPVLIVRNEPPRHADQYPVVTSLVQLADLLGV